MMASPIRIARGTEDKLIVQRGEKKAELTYPQLFSLGHSLFQGNRFHEARDVFAALARIRSRGPRAKIMLARCIAEIESFEACKEILDTIFEGEEPPVAEDLQGAFVFHVMGMRDDAIREMVNIVKQHPDYPTALLYLGDLYLEKGNHAKAVYCWKLAIKRDRRGGAVGITARKQLTQLSMRTKKAKTSRNESRRKSTKRKRR
jgi:thioredoxin-like negative regulator of GroEL